MPAAVAVAGLGGQQATLTGSASAGFRRAQDAARAQRRLGRSGIE